MRRRALAGALLAAFAGPAAAEDDTAAEIGLWKAVTAHGLKSDYEGYLLLFPDGRFAPLARVRIAQFNGNGNGPVRPLAPPVPPLGDINLYRLDVLPAVAARGQPVVVRCRGFLPAALFDLLVVVRGGAPDFAPDGTPDESQFLVKGLAHLYEIERAGVVIPALPPGAYEVRYLSRQYNSDGRMEVMARAGLTVQ